MKIKSWESDVWQMAEYSKGELVKLNSRAKTFMDNPDSHGVVIDYWPANVYESASYEILIDGNVKIIESKYLSRL